MVSSIICFLKNTAFILWKLNKLLSLFNYVSQEALIFFLPFEGIAMSLYLNLSENLGNSLTGILFPKVLYYAVWMQLWNGWLIWSIFTYIFFSPVQQFSLALKIVFFLGCIQLHTLRFEKITLKQKIWPLKAWLSCIHFITIKATLYCCKVEKSMMQSFSFCLVQSVIEMENQMNG